LVYEGTRMLGNQRGKALDRRQKKGGKKKIWAEKKMRL